MKKISKGSMTKKEFRSVFIRSLSMEESFNYERMMNLGYLYSMYPIIMRLYEDKEQKKEAMKRHLEFFNTTSAMAPFILGVSSAMEDENSKNQHFETSSINAMKVALMGPLAGIGDAIFWVSLRIIATGVGLDLALKGNLFGPIVFLLMYNIPNMLCRYFGLKLGYEFGSAFIGNVNSSKVMERVTYAINILGMTVVGGMSASMVYLSVPYKFGNAKDPTTLQSVLDSIMPCMLPMILVFFCYWLMNKKKVKTIYVLFGLLVVGVLAAWLGFLDVPEV